jgi:hypothetical protein
MARDHLPRRGIFTNLKLGRFALAVLLEMMTKTKRIVTTTKNVRPCWGKQRVKGGVLGTAVIGNRGCARAAPQNTLHTG